MRKFATIALCLAILSPVAEAETLRLKYLTTVEVVNDAGKVVETRKLKAGTVIAVEEPQAPAAKDAQKPAKGKKLVPDDISPIPSKTTRSAAIAAQCAATTKKGERCKRNADPGSIYCWQHKK